ncbi:phospholipid-translocating P-type ATPase domain-containing protein [Trichodelitschia bisporula]|uniref:Phospholipid-transporting ATPase n=1 Tax=Trichodelitschia bisporula TaxID=703511 RepID=A0A6G1I7E1_9PEZI|nr:phospholipid-translocating P-type ATPase domain-containing protein [Trichodelitschia bisporula]
MAPIEPQRSEVSEPVKRIRWATRRVAGKSADKKRESLLGRLNPRHSLRGEKHRSKRNSGDVEATVDGVKTETQPEEQEDDSGSGRRIFFSVPLPDDARDDEGRPREQFARNKIRTSKYTPISFIPKNLWFQFHNIANVYFLFIIILGIFSIFGASNPGLNAVPLIVIIFVTAVKDGIEDWRRTVLDNELNNAPVHRLVDFNNVNTAEDHISLWRRFKKANTRVILSAWRWWKSRKGSKDGNGKTYAQRAMDETRPSIETRRASMMSRTTQRTSFHTSRSARTSHDGEGIQLTPVPSPLPGQGPSGDGMFSENDNGTLKPTDTRASMTERRPSPRTSKRASFQPRAPERYHGSLINPYKQINDTARFKKDYWKNVQVGDYLRLYDGEEIPADMVVLSTSDSDGACYVETKNLDGETNLKVRQALHCSRSVKHARHCEMSEFVIESEAPHANLYSYSAVIKWEDRSRNDPDAEPEPMAEPITINNLLLRGSSLRNTEWVLGVVVFTGQETKIMLNSGITPSKRARISKELNWNVIYNFIILFFMCLVAGIVQGTNFGKGNNSLNFFEFGGYGGNSAGLNGFVTFWAAIILFQNLVPISLYITLEIIRTLQAVFIYSDVHMYYEKIDYPCTPKSWNISDDLGQIEYIFSDKTGTLTQNVMEFKKCTINGVPYGEAYTEALAGMHRRQGIDVEVEGAKARKQIEEDKVAMIKQLRLLHNNPYLRDEDMTFVAPDFVVDMAGESGEAQKAANQQFMLVLALCHTVISERTPGDPPKIEFKAQSPDEAALVSTARDCGFTVLGRNDDKIVLNVLGEERQYTVLNTLEFNSTRKRMSAIIRMPDGKIILFCKGADSIIYSRLRQGEQAELRKTTAEHLEMFAREGLRTLCIAQRELSEDEYQTWSKLHDEAAAAVAGREDKLEEVADSIERDLLLLGGTAIEDRLQDGVPDAIQLLGNAGIKLWVLTGDKVETAINIGFSCNLLNNDMDLIVLKIEDESVESMSAELDKHLQTFGMTGSDTELKAAQSNHEPPDPTHAIVIDGDSLKLALDETLRQKFLLLCKQCKAVLCCRVSPSQKAAVVAMVKEGLDCLTLAIGDGANDVAMIQEAHVGVGIAGEEGRQAVMSSDYAIGQFRFLTRLVLVHGRWSYRRLAETIANFFYKNLVWTFALFLYQIYDNFDCSYIYDYTYIILFNLAFTSLPVILMGVLDQDVDDMVSLAVPQLYRRGIERKEWTQPKFWAYMIDGTYQSAIVFYMAYLLFAPANFVTSNGLNIDDTKRIGVFVASTAVVVVNFYILFNTYRWDWLMLLIVAISILLVWFWTGIYTAFDAGFTFYKAAPQVYGSLSFWALLFLTVIMCLLPRFAVKAAQKIFFPRDVDIIREQIRQGRFNYLQNNDSLMPPPPEKIDSIASSHSSHSQSKKRRTEQHASEDLRPIYPPSIAATATTHTRGANGSDGTDYTGHHSSLDRTVRPSFDRARASHDRTRMSMDRVRPSFEQSNDFTSAAMLARLESSQSIGTRWRRRGHTKSGSQDKVPKQ